MTKVTPSLLVALSLVGHATAESAEYPHCWDGYCKNGFCELQPHKVPYACAPEQPCDIDGTYCFVDTYNYPEKGIMTGCNGVWSGLAYHYQTELDKEWEERVKKEKKEGKFSLIVEKWLRKNGKLPAGYDAEVKVVEKDDQKVEVIGLGEDVERKPAVDQIVIELGTGEGVATDESAGIAEAEKSEASSSSKEL